MCRQTLLHPHHAFPQPPGKLTISKNCHPAQEPTLERGQHRPCSPCVSKYLVTHFLVRQPCESRAIDWHTSCATRSCAPHHTTPNRKRHFPPGVIATPLYIRGGMARGVRNSAEWQADFSGFGDIGVWMDVGRFPLWAITNTESDHVRSRPKDGLGTQMRANPTQSWNLDSPRRSWRRS